MKCGHWADSCEFTFQVAPRMLSSGYRCDGTTKTTAAPSTTMARNKRRLALLLLIARSRLRVLEHILP